jgi:hypothetical protein
VLQIGEDMSLRRSSGGRAVPCDVERSSRYDACEECERFERPFFFTQQNIMLSSCTSETSEKVFEASCA